MKRIEKPFVLVLTALVALGFSGSSFADQTWKDIADAQLQLKLMQTQNEIEAAKAKAEIEKARAEAARLELERQKAPPVVQNTNPSIAIGQANPASRPIPNDAGIDPEKIRLVSIYGIDPKNLVADILFDSQVISMSPTNERGVRWVNGWRVVSIDERTAVLKKIEPKDKDGEASGRTLTLALKNAPLAPVVGAVAQSTGAQRSGLSEDLTYQRRNQQPRLNPATVLPPNANQATPGAPVPPQLLMRGQ